MTHPHADRRRFKRIGFDARTELSQNGQRWNVRLVDLSLKGLLVERPDPWTGDSAQPFLVDIYLSPDTCVEMDVKLMHDNNQQLGFACMHIGLQSISHLKRLIELNLADHKELDRELAALIEV